MSDLLRARGSSDGDDLGMVMDDIRCGLWPPKYKVQFTTNTVQSKHQRKASKLECEYD